MEGAHNEVRGNKSSEKKDLSSMQELLTGRHELEPIDTRRYVVSQLQTVLVELVENNHERLSRNWMVLESKQLHREGFEQMLQHLSQQRLRRIEFPAY